nr:unnamed protein product [Callosobruchus chinensis]
MHQALATTNKLTENTDPYYNYTATSVLENNQYELHWDVEIHTDKTVPANRPDIVFQLKTDKVTYLIDIAIPNDKNIQNTYAEKISKYTDLAIECSLNREVSTYIKTSKQEVPKRALSSNEQPGSAKKSLIQALGVSITENMIWHEHVLSIATAAGKKLGYLFRASKYFSPSNLLTLYAGQIRPSLEYSSYIWGAAAPTTLSVLDAIRLTGDLALTCHLQPPSHRRAVCDLSLFYRYSNGFCSSELTSIISPLSKPA